MPTISKTPTETVRHLWRRCFSTIELTNTMWFEKYDYALLEEAFRITADKIRSGRQFRALDDKNVGKYAVRVIQNLRERRSVTKTDDGWLISCTVWIEADYWISEEDKSRFNSQLEPSADCLVFRGAKTTGGYGKFWVDGRSVTAHFFAFFSKLGYLPAAKALGGVNGLQVAHSCRNRSCCNVRHLRLTTKSVNLAERVYCFIDRLLEGVRGDYGSTNGSTNGSVPSRCSSGNPDASQGPPCNDPLADPAVAQRGINRPLNDISSSSILHSPQGNTEHFPVELPSSQPSETPQGVTCDDEITI